jgi:hypothetical protein
MADALRVNGNQVSWGSIVLKIDSERYYGFTSISFSDKRERVKAYGTARHHAPRGRSRGKYTIDPVKLVGWKTSIAALRAALAARSEDGISYGDVEFEVVVQYTEANEEPQTVVIERCVWASNSTSDEESADPLKEEIELDAMLIRRNDLVLFDSSEDQP